jgi:hypothetical protein
MNLDCDSDHLPIAIAIDWMWQQATPPRKRLWNKRKMPVLRQMVEDRLPGVPNAPQLRNKESIDECVSSIINALKAGIEASTPWSKPSPRSIPGFDQECKDICGEVQQLRRRWQRTRDNEEYKTYRKARNGNGRHIRKTLRSTYRRKWKKY